MQSVLLEYAITTGFQWEYLKNSPYTYIVNEQSMRTKFLEGQGILRVASWFCELDLKSASCELESASCELESASCELVCELRVDICELRVDICELRVGFASWCVNCKLDICDQCK